MENNKFSFLAGEYDSSTNLNSNDPEIGRSTTWGEATSEQKETDSQNKKNQKINELREERDKEEKEDSPAEKRLMVIDGAKLNCPYAQAEGVLKVTSNELNLQDKIWATEGDKNNMVNLQFPGICNHPKWGDKKPPCMSVINLSPWQNLGTTTVQEQKVLVKESCIDCNPTPNSAVASPIPKSDRIELEEIKIVQVIGPDKVKGGEIHEYKAIKFDPDTVSDTDLKKIIWNVKYDIAPNTYLGFINDKNKSSTINSEKKHAIKNIRFLSENLLGVKELKVYPFFTIPSEDVYITTQIELLSGVFIWVETKGTGHTFLTVHKNNSIWLYTYGRYDDAYMISLGTTGEGVLIRYTNKLAVKYMKKELYRMDCKVYQIKDVLEDKLIEIFDKQWNSSTEKPDNEKTPNDVKEYGKVIDDYDLTGNNCTTKTCDALKEAGSTIFNFQSYFLGYHIYNYKEYFVIPSSLNDFLIEQKETNPNIIDSTDNMKFAYPNIESLTELKGAGRSAESSGSSGVGSGSSANSSSMENTSSGSSPASSGGSYGSSSN